MTDKPKIEMTTSRPAPLEPFYVRQTFERMTPEEAQSWAVACFDEARSEGAHHARVTAMSCGPGLLVEAWKETTREVCFEKGPREGEPRWQLAG